MDLVKALSSQYMKEQLPEMRVGDTVRHILDNLIAGVHNLAHGHTGIDDGLDGIDTLAVLTLDGGGRESLHYSTYVFDTYGCTISTIDEDVLDVLDTGTVLGRIAHLDVMLVAILTVE